ncbi:MAG: PKD domain-containing protein, partial [Bacteroidales bacterium]
VNYPITAPFAIFDSQNYSNSDGNEIVSIESPFVDASGASCIYLIFDQKFDIGSNSTGQVEVFNGSIWQTVYNIDSNISIVNNQVINISASGAGVSNLKIRFKWNGNNGGYWLIDNVKIYSTFTRDMSVTSINAPVNPISSGNHNIKINLKNYSCSNVSNAKIQWNINNGSTVSYTWNGNLAFNQQIQIDSIGTITLPAGGTFNLKVWISTMNGGLSDMYHLNDTAYITLYPKLCGTFTVGGTNPDFPNLYSVEQALNLSGISCSVIFKIRDSIYPYNQHIKLSSIQGSSSTNTITFESESGNAANCVINYQNVDPTNDYTIAIDSCDNLKFHNLGIYRTNGNINFKFDKPINNVYFYGNNIDRLAFNNTSKNLKFIKNNLTTTNFYNSTTNILLDSNYIYNIYLNNTYPDSAIIITNNNSVGQFFMEKSNTLSRNIVAKHNSFNHTKFTYTDNVICDSNFFYSNLEFRNSSNIKCNYDTSSYAGGVAYYFEQCNTVSLKNSKAFVNGVCETYGVIFESSKSGIFQDNYFLMQSGGGGWWCGHTRYGIRMNNSETVDIKNNFISCTDFTFDGFGIFSSGTAIDVNIENNIIVNSQKGILFDQLKNYSIKNNTIINVKDYFIQINSGDIGLIENNTMNTIAAGNGINLFATNTQVLKNKITTINEGICISNNNHHNTFVNNYLQAGGLGIAKGIYSNAANFLTAYNNSINITSVDRMNGKAIEINGGSDIVLKNNILSNKEGGYSLFVSGNPGNLDFNYNDYYSFKDKLVHFNGAEYDTLTDWKTASGMDVSSVNYNPYYETDTLLKHNQMKLYNAAMQLPSVTTDIYNTSRLTTPDIGAYEYTKCPIDAGVHKFIGLISPLTTGIATPIVVELENHGTSNLTTVIVNWTVNGVSKPAFTWNGNLAPGQTDNDTIGYFTFTPGTTYNLTATTTASNGGTDCNNFNNSARITELGTQLCGVYTIGGSNPDFLNFTEAAVALNSGGIACSVIFKVRNGTYDEHIILNQIQGVSSTATITFESESGDSSLVLFNYTPSDPNNDYTLILNGTDYIRFNKLSILRANNNIFIKNNCKDVRFTNNYLNNIAISGLDSLLIFKNNNLTSNFLSIDYSGNTYSYDLRISNNKFKGLTLNKCNQAKIDSNYISWNDWNYSTITLINVSNSRNISFDYDSLLTTNYYSARALVLNSNYNVKIKNSYFATPGGCDGIGILSENDTLRVFEKNVFFLQNGVSGWCGSRNAIMAKGGDSLIIKNNKILSPNLDNTGTGIYIYDNAITNYEISDNYIELYRNGIILLNNSANNITRNNIIIYAKDIGIKTTGNLGLVIRNSIYKIDGGIGIINEATNSKYYQNRITGIANGKAMTNNKDGVDIQNNYMHTKGDLNPIGLQFIDNPSNCYVYNNNINITGNDATGSAAFEIQNASNLIVKNNIFANQTNGYALKTNTASASFTADKNCFFTYGDFLFNRNGQNIQKLNQWITASGQDANSKNINPFYISDTNLKMNQIQLNNNAEFVGISLDIDSTSRISNNDIGAKVYVPCINDAGIDSVVGMIHNLTSPTMTIKGILQNHGTATLSIVNVYYSVNGATPVLLSMTGLSLGQGATMQISFLIPYTFTAAQSNLKIWTSLPNGIADCNNYNDTAKYFRINGPLCGIYTVGGLNPDFNSIADAVFALNGVGISCSVTFRLRDTIFNQNVAIGPVKGNSFTKTITFERDTFITTYPGINYTVTDINNDFALRLDSTTHVTFRNLTINRQNGNRNVWLRNLNNYITFDSCKINGLITDTLGLDSVLVIKNCDFQNTTLTIIGNNIKRSKNINIKNTLNIGETKFFNIDRINIDSSMFNIGSWNWGSGYNIYSENCKNFIMKNSNLSIFFAGFSSSTYFNNCEDIWLERNKLTSQCYYNYTKTIYTNKCKNISLISNNITPNDYSGYGGDYRCGVFAEKSSNLKVKSNFITSNSYSLSYGVLMIDSVFNAKIDSNTITIFNEGIRTFFRTKTDSIVNNTIFNVNTTGIRIEGDSTVVQKNRIINSANIIGIHVLSTNAKIHQNRILNLTESEGIRVEGTKNLIANNYINITGFGVAKGIVINTGSNFSKIIHNSINITSTDAMKGKAIEINGSDYIEVKKNIFSNKGGGFGAYLNYKPIGNNGWWIDNNIYSSGSKIGYYSGTGTNYSDYLLFNTDVGIGADFGMYNPFFASDTNLLPYQKILNGACYGYPGIGIDIDDKLRMYNATDIGAKEFKVDFGITQMISPTLECVHGNSDTVKIYLKQFGDIPFTDIPLAYSINGDTVYYDTIPGSTFNDLIHSFPVTINISANNIYIFKLWIIDAYDDNKVNDTLIAIRYSKPAPVINFTAPVYCEMRNTNFTSQATVSSPYTIASYQWNFGDGDSANIANPMHVFDSTGIYPVNLRVYSSAGCYKDTLKNVTIHPTPNAEFVMGSQCKGVPVNFTNNSSINSLDTLLYNWNFGDYTNSIQKNPTHTYANAGSIPVQLIASSLFACKDTIMHNITIHTLPVIQLNKQNITCNGLVDGKITALVTSGNPSYHYLWSTNDTTSIINNLHQGIYMLTVTDSLGCIDKDTATIIQPGAITVNFNKKPYVCNGMFNGWIKAIINGGTS